MKRREFLKFLSGAIWPAIWPFAARAQYPGSPYGASPYPTSPYQAPPYQTSPYQSPPSPTAPSPTAPSQATPAAAAAPDDKSVGQVSTLNGHCTVTR
ncbi:MAG TPA: hypothetical protein VG271_13935, partial [Beijerinckiaceae bacterium]|nr:hypothetical protein [Beijerinckiaceae bacterium]